MRFRAQSGAATLLTALLVFSAGCPGGGERRKVHRQRVHVRSFSESAPVRAIAAAGAYLFVGSDAGLERWDHQAGTSLLLGAAHGMPGNRVSAFAHDASRGWLWIATDGGVTRYMINEGSFAEVPRPPSVLGIDGLRDVVLAPAGTGGLWIGHAKGLFYTNPSGQWTKTGVTAPVTALLRTRDGVLWIGTASGLVARQPDGESFSYSAADGCDFASVRWLAVGPTGQPFAVGDNASGQQRVALVGKNGCATYRVSPNTRWLSATKRPGDLVVMTPTRLFTISARKAGARTLTRDGMRLLPVKIGEVAAPRNELIIRPMRLRVPPGPTALSSYRDEIIVGTRELGTARLSTGTRRVRWFRRHALVAGARSLSVACASKADCWVATGVDGLWHFARGHFTRKSYPDERVVSVVRNARGKLYALHVPSPGNEIKVRRLVGSEWTPVDGVAIKTPGKNPSVSFARFSPSGILWIGLGYMDNDGERRPFGVATVDLSFGAVAYHRASRDRKAVKRGVLPIPVDLNDVCFMEDDEVWLASTEGAARVRGTKVTVLTEENGLKSEYLRGISCSAGGMVYVASGDGVGAYDGEVWRYPAALRGAVNDLQLARDNRLWLATDRGVAVFDGARVRRLDVRRGLLDNKVQDLVIDHLGRVWVRSAQGLTVVTP